MTRKGNIPWNKGKTGVYTPEHIAYLRKIQKISHSREETKQKIREARARMTPEQNSNWKGGVSKIRLNCEFCHQPVKSKNKTKCFTCYHKMRRGENHYAWKGGLSYGEYDIGFTKEKKMFVKKIFNNQCIICKETPKKLDVHHIDYNKKNSQISNLVPLCSKHHSRTNFDRETFTKFFQRLAISNEEWERRLMQ